MLCHQLLLSFLTVINSVPESRLHLKIIILCTFVLVPCSKKKKKTANVKFVIQRMKEHPRFFFLQQHFGKTEIDYQNKNRPV